MVILACDRQHGLLLCAGDAGALQLLLEYCLGDVLDTDADSVAQLAGLPLLPLGDGSVGTIQHLRGGENSGTEQGVLLAPPQAGSAVT